VSDTLYRDRVLTMARAQERLRQARDLAQSAAGMLAELGVDGDGNVESGVDLKAEIKLASEARRSCTDAVERLDAQIRRTAVL
jgi:hypothetical protein